MIMQSESYVLQLLVKFLWIYKLKLLIFYFAVYL